MKAESSILVIIFAIAVTNIGLGESRFFFTPNFWMTDSLDHKDAVVDLKLRPYREVVMKRHPSQVSISSGQQNLMKTYHNDANTSGITKIALKKYLDFF